MRMAIVKKNTSNKSWQHGEKGTILLCWWECKLVQPLWRIVWRCLKKLKIELPYDPTIPLLCIYSEKNILWKDTCILVFTVARFTIAKTRKQPKCPLTDEWIKMWYIYVMECYSVIKKDEILPFAATYIGSRDYHTKWSKSDRERQVSYDITYMWNLKKWHNFL